MPCVRWKISRGFSGSKLGVREVGLAPRGRAPWEVEGKVKDQLISERSMVEGVDRHHQVPEIWLQPPGRPLNRHDGRVANARCLV